MTTKSDIQLLFQRKIDAEVKVEPKEWMPDKYRHTTTAPTPRKACSGK